MLKWMMVSLGLLTLALTISLSASATIPANMVRAQTPPLCATTLGNCVLEITEAGSNISVRSGPSNTGAELEQIGRASCRERV
jgi:hypothetical protein